MVFYVLAGVSASFTLFKTEMNRRQGIDELSAVIKKAVEENKPDDVTAWVRLRPSAETKALTGIITPESGLLGPYIFFELSRRQMLEGHMEEALFWSQLGRYRLRYDALRCGAQDSTQALDKLMPFFSPKKIQGLLQQHPELVRKSVRQVMDFDAKYPARNSPAFVCSLVNGMTKSNVPEVPREQWEHIRQTLRAVTRQFLKEMDGKHP